MKTIKKIGMALLAILMSVNFTACSEEDGKYSEEIPEGNNDKKTDFTGYTATDLKINKMTFWLNDDYSGVSVSDWGDGQYIHFNFEGKTEETDESDYITITLNESLSVQDFANNNKNIVTYIQFRTSPRYPLYDYLSGRASLREANGIITLNFNNATFKNNENGDIQTLNGYITFRI